MLRLSTTAIKRLPLASFLLAIALGATLVAEPSSVKRADAVAEAVSGSAAETIRLTVGAGNFHYCAIDSNNGVKCWGSSGNTNTWGQLGQGDTNSYTGPQTVLGLSSGVQQIAVGNTHACALLSADGSVKCWGRNYEGALGNGAATTGNASATPSNVITTTNANLTGVSEIATWDDHTCAIKSGAVLCWGYNIGGMGITGNSNSTLLKATQVLASGAASLAVGNDSSCAIMSDATVKCWGTGGKGQTGNAGALAYNNPAATVAGLTDVAALSVGLGTACALRNNGDVMCWGNNLFGVVGNGLCGFGSGSGEFSATPTGPINNFIGVTAGERIVAISLSYSNGIALTDTGRSIKWGGNTGPCTTGSTWATSLPGGMTVVGITASGTSLGQSCYVRSDSTIVCGGATVAGVTPAGATTPNTPGTPTATEGNGQATITITPPGSGSTPSTYTVTATPGGATCTVTVPATTCTITGLTNGTAYTFSATANNGFGSSTASANSASVTPLAPPDAPGAPTVVVGNNQATITITPAGTGGAPSSYIVTATPGGATCTVTVPATTCTIAGLTNGTAYTFNSTATNASGTSSAGPSSISRTVGTTTTTVAPSSGSSSTSSNNSSNSQSNSSTSNTSPTNSTTSNSSLNALSPLGANSTPNTGMNTSTWELATFFLVGGMILLTARRRLRAINVSA